MENRSYMVLVKYVDSLGRERRCSEEFTAYKYSMPYFERHTAKPRRWVLLVEWWKDANGTTHGNILRNVWTGDK